MSIFSGAVGSGKSSFMNLLLNEVNIHRGEVRLEGSVAYCSQEPWIFLGTIRQNVLFGNTFDHKKYREVISAACLDKDLQLLPQGDETVVGDKGITLSGGQKARIVSL